MSEQPMSGGAPVEPGAERKPTPSRVRPVVLTLAVVGLLGIAAWYSYLRLQPPPAAPSVAPMTTATDAGLAAAPPGPMPSVQESDARARELVGRLSPETELARWLGEEGLVQRFTTAVSNIADGESPRMVLSFLAPVDDFRVIEGSGRTTIDPRSYERYDVVARVIGSLDAQQAGRAYRELKPLVDQVYAEIAPPGQSFDQTFAWAIQQLLQVPVPQGDVEVVPKGALYVYADPALEGLSHAQKHLLRMGPRNIRIIQVKLSELQGALGLPPVAGR